MYLQILWRLYCRMGVLITFTDISSLLNSYYNNIIVTVEIWFIRDRWTLYLLRTLLITLNSHRDCSKSSQEDTFYKKKGGGGGSELSLMSLPGKWRHFFWSKNPVNRTRFHLFSSEFSLYTGIRIELNSFFNDWDFFTPYIDGENVHPMFLRVWTLFINNTS